MFSKSRIHQHMLFKMFFSHAFFFLIDIALKVIKVMDGRLLFIIIKVLIFHQHSNFLNRLFMSQPPFHILF